MRAAAFIALGLLAALTARAADESAINACAAIAHGGERLSCYDRAAPSLPAADAGAVTAAQVASFGMLIGGQAAPPQSLGRELRSITAKVVSAKRQADGRLYVTLDNGQVWQINSRDPLLHAGDVVSIERAAVGSFAMRVPSGRPVKVRRVSWSGVKIAP